MSDDTLNKLELNFDYEKLQEVFEGALENHEQKTEEELKELDQVKKEQEKKESESLTAEQERHTEMLQAITDNDNDLVLEQLEIAVLELQKQNVLIENQNKNMVEGFWLLSIVFVATITIKLFFNQISKW